MFSTNCRRFHSQITAFSIFHKILHLDKFDFKFYNIAFKFQSKTTQIKYFWSKFRLFNFLSCYLAIFQIQGCCFEIWQQFLERHFCSQVYTFLFFLEIWQLGKFEAADLNKPWRYFLQIPHQKYLNKAFLDLKLGIFAFSQNFAIRPIWGWWFQIWEYFFIIVV